MPGNRRDDKSERWIGRYTLIMAAVQGLWLVCMLLSRRTLLCHSDAYYQQYTTLRYTARAVRDLLAGRGFRQVDFSLGQGLDALASLGFYGLTNPFYWLGALFTGRGLEAYYQFLVFLYRWLEGLAFGLYLRRTRLLRGQGWAILAGSLMFAFCGYNTAGVLKCPYFAAGGICLCLTLLAVERCLAEGKWGLVSGAVLLTLLMNFYHGYQTLLMVAAYALARLAYRLPGRGVRGVAREGLGLLAAGACGLLLGGFMLLPTLRAFMGSARSSVPAGYKASLLVFPGEYYRQLVADFFAPYGQANYWTQLNFLPWTAAGLFALLVMRGGERRARWLRAGMALAALGLCVPLAGKAFNGMSYVTNRWSYGFAFVCCLCGAAGLAELLGPEFPRRRAVAGLLAAWAALMVAAALLGVEDAFVTQTVMGVPLSALLTAFGALLLLCVAAYLLVLERRGGGRADPRRARRFACGTLALCCVAYSAGFGALMFMGDEFYAQGLDGRIAARTDGRAAGLGDGAFARVDTGFNADSHAALLGYYGAGYYWSIIPRAVSDYYIDLEAPALRWVFQLRGLGGDPYMSAAAAVGWAVRPDSAAAVLPYGFEAAGDGVYENRYALPLGVFFEDTLSEATWKGLSPLQKRRALLSAAIMDGAEDTLALPEAGEALPVTPVDAQGAALTATALRGGAGGVATLAYDAPEGSLAWLWIRGPRLESGGNASYLQVDARDAGDVRAAFTVPKPEGNYYFPQTGVFLYLGEGGPGEERLALRLADDAELSFEGMTVIAVPAGDYVERVEALARAGGWSPEVGVNSVKGRYEAASAGTLQLSIPFSEGWRARVDGEERPLSRCGGMYMGLALEPGAHDIELRYTTPGLRAGAIATLAGALLCALRAALRARKRGN